MKKARKKSKQKRRPTPPFSPKSKSPRGRAPKAAYRRASSGGRPTGLSESLLSWRENQGLRNAVAAIAGGAGGAILGGFLVRQGVKPSTAAVGVTVAGGVAAMTMEGASRLAAGGAAAAGAGQLALAWMASQKNLGIEKVPAQLPASPPKLAVVPSRQAELPKRQGRPSVETSFMRARKQGGARNNNQHIADAWNTRERDEDFELDEVRHEPWDRAS